MKTKRKAVYTGRRLHGEKVVQRFELLPGKREMFYRNVRGVHIGHTYACSATQMSRRPEWLNEERRDNPEWEAQDALVDEFNARKRAEAKIRALTKPALRAALEALKPLVKGMDYFARVKLVTLLVEKVGSE